MAYVCSCHGITDRTVRAAVAAGAHCTDAVMEACRAGGTCGGCHPTIESLIDEVAPRHRLRRDSAA